MHFVDKEGHDQPAQMGNCKTIICFHGDEKYRYLSLERNALSGAMVNFILGIMVFFLFFCK